MNINTLITKLEQTPMNVSFDEAMTTIDANYIFSQTAFKNGELMNKQGENNGSCKIFSFAKLHQLTEEQTLHCFGDYYRKDVLEHPDKQDHQNIRNFMQTGWSGIEFEGEALEAR